MPKVSIITTTYKHEKFIHSTIESIINQSFQDWELLIGDDSPDDETWNIIQNYCEKYPEKIQAWHHAPNKGIVGNTNFLLEKISPESQYIAFLEGDDMYVPETLEKKIKIFTQYPEVQIVYNDISFIDSTNAPILKSFFHYRHIPFFQNVVIPKDTFIFLTAGPIASWSTAMIRKEIVQKYPIIARWEDKKYSISDYDFYFHIATNYPVFGIDESLTLYRRHTGNLSGSGGGTSGDLGKLIDIYYQEGLISQEIYKQKKSWISITFAIFELEAGNKNTAWKHLKDALYFKPFYGLIYKSAILFFILLPKSLSQKILGMLIKRGS